jgi:sugar phosphate isomerase/epimerase
VIQASAPFVDLERLSLNQITLDQLSLEQAVEVCARAGVGWIAPWRHKLDGSIDRAAELIGDAGLRVSSLCRGGFFPAETAHERAHREADNRRALEEAAALGTSVLVLVCGPAPGRDLRSARTMVAEGIERLVPHATELGVRLAIEPLHPMMIAERSVVVTLAQAVTLAEHFEAEHVGVVVDAYHVWWDPDLERQVERAGQRILGYHVSDWLTPTTDVLAGRGLMGDGVIDLRHVRALVEAAGYQGPIEAEVISSELARGDPWKLMTRVCERYLRHV